MRPWSAGPYQGITRTITDIHAEVIERLRPEPGQRFLDLACGTGAVAGFAAPPAQTSWASTWRLR